MFFRRVTLKIIGFSSDKSCPGDCQGGCADGSQALTAGPGGEVPAHLVMSSAGLVPVVRSFFIVVCPIWAIVCSVAGAQGARDGDTL